MQDLAGNVMSEINVKVRLGTQTLYNTKVLVKLEEPVSVLKKKICEKVEELQEPLIEAVYCGCVMEDCNPIYTYDVFRGATVHVFKKIKTEQPSPPKPLAEADLVKLGVAVRSFSVNPAYRNSMIKHTHPEDIVDIILRIPGLTEDPMAIALLHHSELLVKLGDFEVVKRLAQNHPALASAILHLATIAFEEVLQVILLKILETCQIKLIQILFYFFVSLKLEMNLSDLSHRMAVMKT